MSWEEASLFLILSCNVHDIMRTFFFNPFVQHSVSSSWFFSSRRLTNPRFTLTSLHCCLAGSVVSSMLHCNDPPAAILVSPSTFHTTIFSHRRSWPIWLCSCQDVRQILTAPTLPSKTAATALLITILLLLQSHRTEWSACAGNLFLNNMSTVLVDEVQQCCLTLLFGLWCCLGSVAAFIFPEHICSQHL